MKNTPSSATQYLIAVVVTTASVFGLSRIFEQLRWGFVLELLLFMALLSVVWLVAFRVLVVSERKRLEEQALRSSEERFVKIFNMSPFRMGILRARDGVVLEVNDSWIRDTGFSRDEVINQPIFALAHWMGDDLTQKVRQVIETRQPVLDLKSASLLKTDTKRSPTRPPC